MKKAFVLLCALYAVDSSAMQGATRKLVAAAFATAPVTIPGAYYYAKTTADQNDARKALKEGQDESQILEEHYKFASFVEGAWCGVFPGVNVILLHSLGKMLIQGEEIMTGNPQNDAWYPGFAGGLSLYATVPVALKLLKRVK